MTAVFADTFYFVALFSRNDQGHTKAARFTETFEGTIITSSWVLVEVANALANCERREDAGRYVERLFTSPELVVEKTTEDLLQRGLTLYLARSDKQWSLTDCISFVVMQERGLTEALTEDHHFEQAGFNPLWKS